MNNAENPFRGVAHHIGQLRRDTRAEFRRILRTSRNMSHKTRSAPGHDFIQEEFLFFLWHAGCRPSEAPPLWPEHIDFENEIVYNGGMFFSIDGGDGTGKSTQAALFCQWLEAGGHERGPLPRPGQHRPWARPCASCS